MCHRHSFKDGIVQGDIAVSADELRRSRLKRAATAYNKRLWRDGVIPFVIDKSYTGQCEFYDCVVYMLLWLLIWKSQIALTSELIFQINLQF